MLIQFLKFKSRLSDADVRRIITERAAQFRALPSLLQKYYVLEGETGRFGGIYLWDSEDSMRQYRQSDLARSVPTAYKIVGQPRLEIFEVVSVLRDEPEKR